MRKRERSSKPIYRREVVKVLVGWEHVCEWCGEPFQAKRRDAKTCSDTCRYAKAAQKRRRKAA